MRIYNLQYPEKEVKYLAIYEGQINVEQDKSQRSEHCYSNLS